MLRWAEDSVVGAYRSEQAVVEGGMYEKSYFQKRNSFFKR